MSKGVYYWIGSVAGMVQGILLISADWPAIVTLLANVGIFVVVGLIAILIDTILVGGHQ